MELGAGNLRRIFQGCDRERRDHFLATAEMIKDWIWEGRRGEEREGIAEDKSIYLHPQTKWSRMDSIHLHSDDKRARVIVQQYTLLQPRR